MWMATSPVGHLPGQVIIHDLHLCQVVTRDLHLCQVVKVLVGHIEVVCTLV